MDSFLWNFVRGKERRFVAVPLIKISSERESDCICRRRIHTHTHTHSQSPLFINRRCRQKRSKSQRTRRVGRRAGCTLFPLWSVVSHGSFEILLLQGALTTVGLWKQLSTFQVPLCNFTFKSSNTRLVTLWCGIGPGNAGFLINSIFISAMSNLYYPFRNGGKGAFCDLKSDWVTDQNESDSWKTPEQLRKPKNTPSWRMSKVYQISYMVYICGSVVEFRPFWDRWIKFQ